MINRLIKEFQDCVDPKAMSPLVLAYLGDAVFELYIRTKLAMRIPKVKDLHKCVVSYVRADSQSSILSHWDELLTEEEKSVVRRGRNAKSTVPRNADMSSYRYSTGFEALLGYLYVKGDQERLWELLETIDIDISHN